MQRSKKHAHSESGKHKGGNSVNFKDARAVLKKVEQLKATLKAEKLEHQELDVIPTKEDNKSASKPHKKYDKSKSSNQRKMEPIHNQSMPNVHKTINAKPLRSIQSSTFLKSNINRSRSVLPQEKNIEDLDDIVVIPIGKPIIKNMAGVKQMFNNVGYSSVTYQEGSYNTPLLDTKLSGHILSGVNIAPTENNFEECTTNTCYISSANNLRGKILSLLPSFQHFLLRQFLHQLQP